jgi:hypothetical protein
LIFKFQQVWSLHTQDPTNEVTIPTVGFITHIQVSNDIIMWAVNSPIAQEQAELTVGVVHLLNTSTSDFQTIPIKVSIHDLQNYSEIN